LVRVQVGDLLLPTTYIVHLHFVDSIDKLRMQVWRQRQRQRQRERERERERNRAGV
jgi:hypothetical protein